MIYLRKTIRLHFPGIDTPKKGNWKVKEQQTCGCRWSTSRKFTGRLGSHSRTSTPHITTVWEEEE